MEDLLGKVVRTASGVEVSTPTVRNFYRCLEVYRGEIHRIRTFIAEHGNKVEPELLITFFLATPEDKRLEYVLGSRTDMEERARAWIPFIVPLASAINGRLRPLDEVVVFAPEDDDEVDDAVAMVLRAADCYHIDPMAVMDWPLGLFLDVTKAFSKPPRTPGKIASAEPNSIQGIVG
jgi:hypothetical protein